MDRTLRGWRLALVVAVVVLVGGGVAVVLLGGGKYDSVAWKRIVPGGDCQCADGSEFAFWERPADPTKVVVFLNGGGVCWDATTCAFSSPPDVDYDWNIQNEAPEDRTQAGFFDFTRGDNPFADYTVLFVTACTGDAHLGNVAHTYSPQLTVEHRGYVNGTAALDHLAKHYPKAAQVVVMGKTAGSVAAPVYGGLVADRLPDAKVTVFGGQSGAWPDNPDFNTKILSETWGAYDAMPDWAVKGLTARDWGVPRFWIQAGRHDPDLVLARFDYAFDPNAAVEVTQWMDGNPPDLLAITDANEKAIEAAGVKLHSYTAPGDDHGIFEFDKFYDLEVNGVQLVDWLTDLIDGRAPKDVHCDKCGP